ncbi:late expression factor 3 [Malacosoma neustria nucleopolyhedrovirus]|uniref:late expression factor 3 n=1 Tax=Malacosoma neustria nuclear polyhedrosis virus TaxID=38012 RepID=UPI000E35C9F7|nr:late expression factor 3 [Malacosoma neustria nucleopolyhedrovirus]AUF81581.1 late expression factor 3 [Malacosoma neustria nucleopolyhedrovirus]
MMNDHDSSASSKSKRKLEIECEDDNQASSSKLIKIDDTPNTNEKRALTLSATSNDASYKSVVGELICSNMVSLDNTHYYLFKFLIDNNEKLYYGNTSQFYNMKNNFMYEIFIERQGRKLYIHNYNEIEKKSKASVKTVLSQNNFDENDTVSVQAKFNFGFKMICGNAYKMTFTIYYGVDEHNKQAVQIESTGDISKFKNLTNKMVSDENDLLHTFKEMENKIINIYRIKCEQSHDKRKYFNIQNITQIEVVEENKAQIKFDSQDALFDISRMNNKLVIGEKVREFHAKYTPSNNYEKYNIKCTNFKNETIVGAFFLPDNNGPNKKKDNMLEKCTIEFNQLEECLNDNIIEMYIYVLVDVDTGADGSAEFQKSFNLLGISVLDVDSLKFESV